MLERARGALTYANVVATLALVLGSAGGACAAFHLAPGSVGTRALANRAVTGVKVARGTLLAVNFKRGELPAGKAGPPGPRGPSGPAGSPGPPGPAASPPEAAGLVDAGATKVFGAENLAPANVVHPTADSGVYCFYGLNFEPTGVSVTPSIGGLDVRTAEVGLRSLEPDWSGLLRHYFNVCPASVTQAIVAIRGADGGFTASSFYVRFS